MGLDEKSAPFGLNSEKNVSYGMIRGLWAGRNGGDSAFLLVGCDQAPFTGKQA
jgi:hypothetical protein